MPLDLSRAENIGEEREPPKPRSDLIFGQTEVLNVNKVPFDGVSFLRDGFHQCPFCRRSAIKQIIDYRCLNCGSRVIQWKCYVTKEEDQHILYDNYISSFHIDTEAKMNYIKEQQKKEGKKTREEPDEHVS